MKLPERIPKIQEQDHSPEWLSIFEASQLARLAQMPAEKTGLPDRLRKDFMPAELTRLQGGAFRIGREIWRQKTDGPKPACGSDIPWTNPGEEETAQEIINWDRTNRMMSP